MYGTGSKKMLNMLILNILKEYSDERHRLTQQEIIRLLKENYAMDCDRRSVKNNILSLQEMGYEISMEDGYYLMERDFEDAELRLLIDAVLFSHNMTTKQAKILIEKLKKHSNRYFSAKVNHVSNLPELHHSDNTQLLYVLDAVNDAISEDRKISFCYNEYGTDFKLHPRREEPYIVNPIQMVAGNARYYLICNVDKYDNIAHFRLDKMTYVTILDEARKSPGLIEGMENGLDLPKHMAEHVYMFSGETVTVRMKTTVDMMDELVDWFGKDFHVIKTQGKEMEIMLRCNEQAMFYWALQYGQYVEVTEPESLVKQIQVTLSTVLEKYK